MKRRVPLLVILGLCSLLLVWWLLGRPSAPPDGEGPMPDADPAVASTDGANPTSADRRAGHPAVHLPQIQEAPDDIDPERRGPSNLPAGTERTRLAASGKLAHYVIEEYADSFRECYEQHLAADPELPDRALLEFTIDAEPRDTGNQYGQVREVQVLTSGPDYELMEHNNFEFCCTAAVIELELDPPGGRKGGSMRFGMTLDLATGDLVDENRGQGQAQ